MDNSAAWPQKQKKGIMAHFGLNRKVEKDKKKMKASFEEA